MDKRRWIGSAVHRSILRIYEFIDEHKLKVLSIYIVYTGYFSTCARADPTSPH